MSIYSEIRRIKENISGAYDEIELKSGTLPASQNSDNLASAIDSIPISVTDPIKIETESVIMPLAHPVELPELDSPVFSSQVRAQEQPIGLSFEIITPTLTTVEVI